MVGDSRLLVIEEVSTMGGINCPKPRAQGEKMTPTTDGDYVSSLARYSGNLFTGAACFFQANAAIEEAILDRSELDVALGQMKSAASKMLDAQSEFGAVMSLVSNSSEHDIDFPTQMEMLGELAEALTITAEMLGELSAKKGHELQEEIWGNPNLTQQFVACLEQLSAATAWQASFATNKALIPA